LANPAEHELSAAIGRPSVGLQSFGRTTYAVRITLSGRVRGVGIRTFVYRLARQYGLTGHVGYDRDQLDIVACGRPDAIKRFRRDLILEAPPLSSPQIVRLDPIDTVPFDSFEIVTAPPDPDARDPVSPDYTMCAECRAEFTDPDDRRHGYPFISCAQCGPRYALMRTPSGRREDTTMSGFRMCAACELEFGDPTSRRFQWASTACPDCGPSLLLRADGEPATRGREAIAEAARRIAAGGIVAVKDSGGYRLMCSALDEAAVDRLRRRKRQSDMPFAVVFPLRGRDGLGALSDHVAPHRQEAEAIRAPGRPIVIVHRRKQSDLADNVAPGLGDLGVQLPDSPLAEAVLDACDMPLAATSGNRHGEPVIVDSDAARQLLDGIADAFLDHDLTLLRPVEDTLSRRIAGRVRPMRLGRGVAPLELHLPSQQARPTLAIGADAQGTVALSWDHRVVVSSYLGDMHSPAGLAVLAHTACELQSMYRVDAERVVCDADPAGVTHRWARAESGMPVETVWRHHAHASALAAEIDRPGLWLVFVWDRDGLGDDGTLWGAEALVGSVGSWRRVGGIRPLAPGNEETSAAARVFDTASAVLTGQVEKTCETQTPLRLEGLCRRRKDPVYLSLSRDAAGLLRSDWRPLLDMLVDERLSPAGRSERFHASLALSMLQQARRIADEMPIDNVGLCGSILQDRMLTEQACDLLTRNDFHVHLPLRLPFDDAALGFGQAAELAAREAR